MVKKVTELTEQQEAKLPEYRDKWIALGLSTEKTDRAKVNAAIDKVYACADLKPPKIRVWLRSPYEGVIGAWWLKQVLKTLKGKGLDQARTKMMAEAGDHGGDQVCDKIRNDILAALKAQFKIGSVLEAHIKEKLGEPIKNKVRDHVWSEIWHQVKDQHVRPRLGDPIWDQVWNNVWHQVSAQVWSNQPQVGLQLGPQIRGEVISQVKDMFSTQMEDLLATHSVCAGLHEANLLGPDEFFGKELGADIAKLSGLIAAAEHCGWFWPFGGAVIITEKPTELCRDPKGRLHHEKELAIKYSDGWGVGMWYGTRVENWVITNPELITLDKVIDEKNAAARRVLRERFGLQDFFLAMMKEDKVKKISRRKDSAGMPMSLYRYLEKEGPLHFVHVYNGVVEEDGTRKEFIITCKNVCDDAMDSLIGTYPDLMKELKDNPRRFEILKASIR